MGGTVSEYYDEHTVPPSIAERTRGSIARRIAAVRLLGCGVGPPGDLGAIDTDSREPAVDTKLGWAEHIKQQYDVGDGSDAGVAAVLDAIQQTEGELANTKIGETHF